MKKKLKYSLTIEITDILITVKYYSFKYSVKINNKIIHGIYESSHSFKKDMKEFEKILKKGYAFELVLDKVSTKYLKVI